jgi:signal transduction histidine kinase
MPILIADIIIGIASGIIAVLLGCLLFKTGPKNPYQSILFLFFLFIVAAGISHVIDAVHYWWPMSRASVPFMAINVAISIATVFAVARIIPMFNRFRSPHILQDIIDSRTAELKALNRNLEEQVLQRELVEKKLKEVNQELQLKTVRLEKTNLELISHEHDLVKSEDMIKQLNSDLEKKIEERTVQLRDINNELEAFTYSVSHDLRAPLRAIDGYARILDEDYQAKLDRQGKHFLSVITKNARYMGQLIDDLLEFSRTSRTEIVKSSFNTSEEVKAIINDLRATETDRDLEISVSNLENCPGDSNMLKQVWVNLISNAIKYTRKTPHAKIAIGCSRDVGATTYFVKDNGVGFDMEYIGKLFGVFQRLHRKEDFEGTGVGLALVKRILDRHHGRVWAEARLNEGATFFFSLPQG